MAQPTGFFVTDLDGTLATNVTAVIHPDDRAALARLGTLGVIRVVATGRSLTSLQRVLEPDFPIDYVVFSTGAGIARWPDGEILLARNLHGDELVKIATVLEALNADFMAHHPVPENHHFHYQQRNESNADFQRRLSRHTDCCERWDGASLPKSVSEFLVVDSMPSSATLHNAIADQLPGFAVTRATSPLDGVTTWTEIFAAGVTKGTGCQWLFDKLKLPPDTLRVAVGNDYNDLALLQWAGRAFVTADAPAAVRACGETVAAAANRSVSEAIARTFPPAVEETSPVR